VISCLLAGGVAALVFLFSRDVIDTWVSRLGLAAVTVLIPLAAQEPVGNLANLHWYLLFLTPWLLLATPRSTAGAWAMAVLALAIGLTEFQALIFTPIALWRLFRSPRARLVMLGFGIGVGAQALTYLLVPRERVGGQPPLLSTIYGYLANVSLSVDFGSAQRTGAVLVRLGWWAAAASLLAFLVVGAFAFVYGRSAVRVMLVVLLLGSALSWGLSFVFNNAPSLYYSLMDDDQLRNIRLIRWGTAASMMLASVVPLAAGVLTLRFPRWQWVGIVGTVVLLGGMSFGFISADYPRDGVGWTTEVDRAQVSCAVPGAGEQNLPTAPEGWTVVLDCAEVG